MLPLCVFAQLPSPKWVDDIGGPGDSKATGMATDNQNNIYVTGYFTGTVDFDPTSGVKNLTSVGGDDIYVAKYKSDGTLVWAVSMGGNGLDQANYLTVDASGNPTIIGQFQSTTLNAGAFSLTDQGAEDAFIIHLNTNGVVLWAKSFGGPGTDRGEEGNADAQGNVIVTSIFQSGATLNGTPLSTSGGNFNGLITKYDPSGNVLWDINIGATGDAEVYGDGIDNAGNIVVSGYFNGTADFDPLGTHHNLTSSSVGSSFVAKYSPAGKLIWVNLVDGQFIGNQSVVSIDANNDIDIAGAFQNPITFNGSTTLLTSGDQDTFLAKYTSNGTFVFAEHFSGTASSSFPYQIRTDKNNNIYISGYFGGSIDFNPDPAAAAMVTYNGQRDFFVAKYDPTGKYQWAFNGGSPNCDNTFGIELAVDNNNDVVLAGSFCQTVDFDPSTCATDNVTAQNSITDTYIAKYIQTTAASPLITAFTIPQQISPAVINQVSHTITLTVAPGSTINALVPTVTTNTGTTAPLSGVTEDFSSPVTYTVTSNCISVPYTVKVILAVAKTLNTCSGSSNVITGDVANPVPDSYVWQEFQNQTNIWTNAPGVINAKDYQTSTLTNGTASNVIFHLRRQVTTGGVVSYDSFYDVTVQPSAPITVNTLTAPSPASFCGPYLGPGGTPTPANIGITGSTPTGGTGTYTYQWQSSTDNITFTNISGQTNKDLTVPAVNVTTYFRRIVISGTCATPSTSNVIIITILPVIANDAITAPAVTTFCSTATTGIITGSTPTGGTGVYTYQWQSSADNVNFTDITGATAKDYDPSVISTTTYFRRTVVSGPCNTPLTSNVVTVTVVPAVANNVVTAPSVVTFCVNGDPAVIVGSVPTGGDGTYIYQWQRSSDNISFTNIPGATLKDYDPAQINATTYYRRTVTSGACTTPLIGNVVTITILSVVANNTIAPPAVTTFCGPGDPGTITGTVPTGGNGTYFYQWQSSPDGINFTDIPGGSNISKDLVIALISTTTYYRRTVTSGVCNVPLISNVVEIIVSPAVTNNVITGPSVTNFCSTGDPGAIIGNTPSGGNGTYTYQWQSSTDNVNFTNISGATIQNFDPAVVNATTYYRRTVNSGTCTPPSLSNVISVIIASPPSAPVISNPTVTICPGNTATISITSPQQGVTYDWYDSPSKINHLFTGTSYTTNLLNTNTTFYVQASNGPCSSPLATAQINVSGVPAAPSVAANAVAVCNGSVATLSISNPQAGLTYNWYTSSTGGSSVFLGTNFVTSALTTSTTYYAEAVNGGGCASATRTPVNVTVNPIPQITAQGASICSGTNTNLTATSSDQNAVVNWYISASGGNILFTGGTFSTPNLSSNTTYYAEAANNTTGCTSPRTAVQVQMIQPLAAPVVTVASTTTSSVTFQWDAVGGATGYQISIDGGQTFIDPSSGSNGLTHTVDGLQAEQSVTIQVRATGNASCALSASSTAVTGTAASPLGDQIFVPNAFTPNGDGKNDVVYVHSENIKSLKFYVYDQWGELLYTSLKQENGWDGTYRGTREPVGVYVYYVEAVMNDGHQVTKKGTITLIR